MKNYLKQYYAIRYIYSKFPVKLKTGYKQYKYIRDLLKKTEFLSKRELYKFQFQKLKEIINYTWKNVDGYKELWEENNFHPEKLKLLEDINLIPFVTKEMLRKNIEKFSTSNKLTKKIYSTTGGTTGIPFGFYNENKNSFIEKGFIHDIWSRKFPQISLNTKVSVFRGTNTKEIVTFEPLKGLVISSYNINVENVIKYLKALEKYKSPILHAYTSSIYVMSKIMKENNLKINHKFDAIMLGSEVLYDFQREYIENVFNSKISHWYGLGEKNVLAGNCEFSNKLHIYPQYGLTEIIGKDGNQVKKGKTGEIVGTSFWAFATPFIRYKNNDFAELGEDYCSSCGRKYQLINNIDGRIHEFVVSKKEELVALTGITVTCGEFDDIKEFRFYQDKVGKIVFMFKRLDGVETVNTTKIYDNLMIKLTKEFDLLLKEVDIIEKTDAGKARYLIQKLDINKYL